MMTDRLLRSYEAKKVGSTPVSHPQRRLGRIWDWPIWRAFSLCASLTVWIPPLAGQTLETRFRHLSIEDGLSQSTVRAIIQDSKGFMWFATQEGLNRFDGHEIRVHDTDARNPNSLSGTSLYAIVEGPNSTLWLGSDEGLTRFDQVHQRFTRFFHDPADPKSLSNNFVRDILLGAEGFLWVATSGGGLNVLTEDGEVVRHFRQDYENDPHSLADDFVFKIIQDREGRIWVGTAGGLDLLNRETGTFTHFRHDPDDPGSLSNDVVIALFPDQDGTLWVGTDGGGLDRFVYGEGVSQNFRHDPDDPRSLGGNSVSAIFRDRTGVLWVATDGGGLNRLDEETGQFDRFVNDPEDPWSLSDSRVLSLYEDRSGILWVGTYGGGVDRFGKDAFKFAATFIQPADSSTLNHSQIRGLSSGHDGTFWIGTEGAGLVGIDKTTGALSHYRHRPGDLGSLSGNDVFGVITARDGTLWAGTGDGVLNHFDPTTGRFQRYFVPVPAGGLRGQTPVRGLYEDESGTIWVGTDGGGLHEFSPENGTFQSYYHDPADPTSLSSNRVYLLYGDATGTLWIPTLGAGLNRLDPGSTNFVRYENDPNDPNTVVSDYLLAVLRDESDNLWIGADGGLSKLDLRTGTFTTFYTEDGLPNDVLYGILEDDRGHLWLSHNAGIARFDPESETFRNYDIRDGLQSNEFNGGSFYESPEGEFFFGGINGYNSFFPDSIRDNPYVPNVVITQFDLFNDPVSVGQEIDGRVLLDRSIEDIDTLRLSYEDYVISFEFAGLSYAVPEKNQFAYMLEGLDKDWNDARDRRYAAYAKLPPGWYTFRVKASNNDGVWNEEGASLVLQVRPPWWQTWLAKGTGAGLLIFFAFGVYRIRIQNIRNRNRRLEAEVVSRTSHLEQTLRELKDTKDQLVETAHKAGMAEIATGVLHNVGNVLNSISTSNSVIQVLLRESKTDRLGRANDLLRANMDDPGAFLTQDPKGKGLAKYYVELEKALGQERDALMENADRMAEGVKVITDVIAAQQSKAKGGYLAESILLEDVVEDALKMVFPMGSPELIDLETRFDPVPPVTAQKSKLIHVLVNLIKNARDSFLPEDDDRLLRIETWQGDVDAFIRVTDSGRGISPENLKRVFTMGFTTKEHGHGFGLHSCANYMTEMGGRLRVDSEGEGQGASFTVTIPLSGTGAHAGRDSATEGVPMPATGPAFDPEIDVEAHDPAGLQGEAVRVG